MTREQVETEMAQYRTIFTVVRLLDAAQVGGEESINSFCSCYSYWGKNTPCRNCISRQVLEDHRQRTKLEYMGSEVFQVTAVYREVDGVPCVMELVQKLDGETLIDPENGDRLIDSITRYHTKLYHDALTDSYNRLYFEDELKDKTDPAGVAVLDLDDFKLIKDTYGHQAGDMALRTCVDVVRASIRKSDVLIRYGGDEFLLVLPGIERAAFLAKLDRIREQLHTASVPGYSRLQLSSSIGGVITQPGETVEQVIGHLEEQADVATYIKTLDFPVDIVSCEYHTAFANPEVVNQLHDAGCKAAFWTVNTEDVVRSLVPLGPDCFVTDRPDVIREWIEKAQAET